MVGAVPLMLGKGSQFLPMFAFQPDFCAETLDPQTRHSIPSAPVIYWLA